VKKSGAFLLVSLVLASGCDKTDGSTSDKSPSPPAAPTSAAPASPASSSAPNAAGPSATAAAPPRAPERPFYYDRPITEADLAGRTLREFSLMRNTIYARAGNKFRKPWLNAYFGAQPWYKPLDVMDESKITPLDRANARIIADADAALSREELERRRDEVLARRKGAPLSPDDAIELSLLSERMGIWLGGEEKPAEARSPMEDPAQLDRLLRVEDLSTLSRRDLRILRNMVYARRGRPFQSAVVKEYFKGAAWYRPDDNYHDGRLNEVDHKNIRLVKSMEDSLGGPLHENPDYGKDGWFFMA
jgi:hypothetical protein